MSFPAALALAAAVVALALGSAPKGRVAEGARLFHARSCDTCHTIDGSKSVGPSLEHLYGSEVRLEGGRTVRATARYLRESIRRPRAQVVEGFRPQMPSLSLPPNEVDALVAFIESLR